MKTNIFTYEKRPGISASLVDIDTRGFTWILGVVPVWLILSTYQLGYLARQPSSQATPESFMHGVIIVDLARLVYESTPNWMTQARARVIHNYSSAQ